MESDSSAASGTPSQAVAGQEAGSVCRKMIQAQDVCPICQEELLEKKLPVSYCRCVEAAVVKHVSGCCKMLLSTFAALLART